MAMDRMTPVSVSVSVSHAMTVTGVSDLRR
jgi:hypothetical protein